MKYTLLGIVCILLSFPSCVSAQNADSTLLSANISEKLSAKYIQSITNRSGDIQMKMEEGTDKYLNKLKDQEDLIQKQLSKIDASAANRIFTGSQASYEKLQNDIKGKSENILRGSGRYFPAIDSALTSLKFLEKNNLAGGKLGSNSFQAMKALSSVKNLEDQFKQTDNIEEFIKQREVYLQQQLASYKLPGLDQYKQQAAYYAQQMKEYKEAWEDPSKIEEKAIKILNKIPAFQEFVKKNSMIAGLFNLPDDYGASGVAGLQTKDQVQQMMKETMKMMGPNGAQEAQLNIGDAQSSLTTLRGKINQGSSELDMPDGKSNAQHTRSFLKRIQYGIDMQSTKSTFYFPSQTQFCFTAGYKLNDRNTVGMGVQYSVGWGRDIQHISITNQAIGFRSFGEFKIKGSFYGSAEFDYDYSHPFASVAQLRNPGLWTKSGLVGITKLVSINSKLVKKTKLQLLWNFLSYYSVPQTQPIVFRVGYNF